MKIGNRSFFTLERDLDRMIIYESPRSAIVLMLMWDTFSLTWEHYSKKHIRRIADFTVQWGYQAKQEESYE